MEICNDLYTIGIWTAPTALHLIRRNPASDILQACRVASEASDEASAIDVLEALKGVAVTMASAILTTMDESRYTVIGWRAREALGNPKVQQKEPAIEFYLCYLDGCRRLAEENGVTLRKLDQALWAWSAIAGPNPSRTRKKSLRVYTDTKRANEPKQSDQE